MTQDSKEHLINSIEEKYAALGSVPPLPLVVSPKMMQMIEANNHVENRATIAHYPKYKDSITAEKERRYKKYLATCAKNRKKRKSKKRK
jgi:hypothetical protein